MVIGGDWCSLVITGGCLWPLVVSDLRAQSLI